LIYENINGHDFIFDTTQQITWTRDADLTNSTYTWQDANTWASKLSIDGINTQGWHLPNVTQFTSLYTQLYPFGEPGTQDAKYGAQVFLVSGPMILLPTSGQHTGPMPARRTLIFPMVTGGIFQMTPHIPPGLWPWFPSHLH